MPSAIWNDKEKRWTLRAYISQGKYKKFSSSLPGIKGKKEVLRKYRQYQENGVDLSKTTVSKAAELFTEHIKAKNGDRSASYYQYESIIRLYVIPAVGNMKCGSVNLQTWQSIINNVPVERSERYLKNVRATLRVFIHFLYENGYIEPLRGDLYIPKGRTETGEKEILQPEDIRRLFEPSDLWYHRAFCFMLLTGVRTGELVGLKWTDVKPDHIEINRAINSRGITTPGKTKNAKRRIPISDTLRRILDEQRAQTNHLGSEYIFCNPVGDYCKQGKLRKEWEILKRDRNLPGTPYSLRHTFISLVKNAMPEQMIKSIVGHSVSMDTFGTYGHYVDGEAKKAAEITDLIFEDLKHVPKHVPNS